MKNFFKYLSFGACAVALFTATGCADTDGDGEGEFVWEGSQNPENVSYRNPVWEPSLAGGTVLKSGSTFAAISQETEWAAGVKFACPSLLSSNLMTWQSSQEAFTYPVVTNEVDPETGEKIVTPGSMPSWITGKISQVSADFARTLNSYWMMYGSNADNAIGAASAPSGLGPYTDQGSLLTAEALGVQTLREPHFSVIASTNFYLGYTTEAGSYLQQLTINRGKKPTLRGTAKKVSGPEFTNICIFRKSSNEFYLFGAVKNGQTTEIRYAKGTTVTGPFVDRNGVEITDGSSNGELLIEGGEEFINPTNPMRLFESENGHYYLAYNATAVGRDNMPSGYARQPLFLSPLSLDDNGWFNEVIVPKSGWTAPRFQ